MAFEVQSETVGVRLRAFRKAKGMTLAQVCELSGVDAGNLSRIESGKTKPSLDTLAKLTQALQVSLGEVAEGLDASEPDRKTLLNVEASVGSIKGEPALRRLGKAELKAFGQVEIPETRYYRVERAIPKAGFIPGDVLVASTKEPTVADLMINEVDGHAWLSRLQGKHHGTDSRHWFYEIMSPVVDLKDHSKGAAVWGVVVEYRRKTGF